MEYLNQIGWVNDYVDRIIRKIKNTYNMGHNEKFDFLGYTFRPRVVKARGKDMFFVGFNPAVSNKAAKAMGDTIRSWRIQLRSGRSIEDISRSINPVVRGWINYYGRYFSSALSPIFYQLNNALRKWAMRKYKKLRGSWRRAARWLRYIARREPGLFAHWQFRNRPSVGR